MKTLTFAASLLLLPLSNLLAHSVPSLTVEATFNADRSYVMTVNVDPRLFLSTKPASLPPVDASWYRDQSATDRQNTEKSVSDYLKRALGLSFSGARIALPTFTVQAIDGAMNTPLSADTKEVHLLAEIRDQLPVEAHEFTIQVSKDANASLILINGVSDQPERRPQVLFPGETSRPYELPTLLGQVAKAPASVPEPVPAVPATPPADQAVVAAEGTKSSSSGWGGILAVVCVIAGIVMWLATRRKPTPSESEPGEPT